MRGFAAHLQDAQAALLFPENEKELGWRERGRDLATETVST